MVAPRARPWSFRSPRAGNFSVVARRGELDLALVELAKRAGADVRGVDS
ncbi:MAG: hypothetical protein R2710_05315 [Acidimicrobiales bacterium]